jgi:PAS domain S-box-containing protein
VPSTRTTFGVVRSRVAIVETADHVAKLGDVPVYPQAPVVKAFDQEVALDLREQAKAIDTWSGRIRRLRGPVGDALGVPEADILREELNVAEEELRSQHDELVTARIATELEREQYRQLFDGAPVAYVVTDVIGNIQHPNSAAASLFGVDKDRLGGKPLPVYIETARRTDFRLELARLVASGESSGTMRVTFHSRDGVAVDTHCVIGVARDRGLRATELRWLIVPDSVALREERERLFRESEKARIAAEDANRAKTELLATVSHELRTPLNAISGYSELLSLGLRGPLTAEQATDVERIRHAQSHMGHLLDDLLLYFRLGLGGLSATVTTAAIKDITTGLTAFVAPQANQRRISVTVSPYAGSARVLADVDRCRQILINLLTNAVKFSADDGAVDMRVVEFDESVDIEVRDQGAGIPAERIDAIFEPFVQLDATGTTKSGFGLGLAISRKLAELMGGSLRARSVVGEGSCFVLSLPKAS